MKEFVMIFRTDALPEVKFSPDELQSTMKVWENWMDTIIAQNILVSRGNRLGTEGLTIKPGKVIVNGPYAEIKEIIGGFIVIRAKSIAEAGEIAMGCPFVIGGGGTVELRNIIQIND